MEDKDPIRTVSMVKDQVTIGEVTYDIRKLSWRSLQRAAEAKQIAQAKHMKSLGGEIFREIGAATAASEARAEKLKTIEGRAEERYASYDMEEILTAGIERVNGQPSSRQYVTDELDEPTAKALHRRIVDLSCGPLDPELNEEVEGKS